MFPVPSPHLSLSLKLSCFYLETVEQHKNHLLVLRGKIPAVSVAIALALCQMEQWRHSTAYWRSQNILLSWGFGFFPVCETVTAKWMHFLQIFGYGSRCFLLHQELINPIHWKQIEAPLVVNQLQPQGKASEVSACHTFPELWNMRWFFFP